MKDILIKIEKGDTMDNKKSAVKLDSISRIKKYGDPESRKYLLELAKDSYELVNRDIVTLVESLEIDIDKHPETSRNY